MNDIENLLGMDWRNGILFIAAVVIVAVFIIQKFDWIIERFGIQSKRQLAEQKQDKDINELKEHAHKTNGNFEKICVSIDEIQNTMKVISDKVDNLQNRINENDIATIGDRITQAYNFYRKRGTWTQIEKWAFDNMINQYKSSGGDGWIDEVVYPRSREWEIVDE